MTTHSHCAWTSEGGHVKTMDVLTLDLLIKLWRRPVNPLTDS